MDNTQINSVNASGRANARDFFLHLGAIVALYTTVISFINLLFRVINRAFPEVVNYGYYWSQGSEISMPVATLIIVFPIFLVLSAFTYRSYREFPDKKHLAVRRWLTYITLFVAGIVLAGDLVTVLYKFLDGQDLTTAFLLKALTVLVVSGAVFGFYLQDIRDRVSSKQRKIWAIAVGVLILISVVLGFSVIGSPKTQRLLREDSQKIIELQNLEWQVINYWQVNGIIPDSLSVPEGMEYAKIGDLNFELCAFFNLSDMDQKDRVERVDYAHLIKGDMNDPSTWLHTAGRHCFEKTIDPVAFPTQVRG